MTQNAADFVGAGEVVFNAPTTFGPLFFSAANLRDRAFYKKTGMPVAKDGTVPFARCVIREKGQVDLGSMGCKTCHTRVLPDGPIRGIRTDSVGHDYFGEPTTNTTLIRLTKRGTYCAKPTSERMIPSSRLSPATENVLSTTMVTACPDTGADSST